MNFKNHCQQQGIMSWIISGRKLKILGPVEVNGAVFFKWPALLPPGQLVLSSTGYCSPGVLIEGGLSSATDAVSLCLLRLPQQGGKLFFGDYGVCSVAFLIDGAHNYILQSHSKAMRSNWICDLR